MFEIMSEKTQKTYDHKLSVFHRVINLGSVCMMPADAAIY